jgi:hypothetical protein
MSNTPPNLGNIIPSGRVRKIIYGVYAGGAVAVGGVVAYFLGAGIPLTPEILGAQGVVAYVGIAVGGLALANTSSAPPA